MAPNNLLDLFSECGKYILKPNSRHFHTLTLIFLFPLSFSFLLFATLTNIFHPSSTTNLQPQLFFSLLFSLFALVFSNCGLISISYSVFHFFHGQPVKLISAIKSISTSFFPLFATTIVTQAIFFFISLFYALLLVILIYGAELVHVTISYSSPNYFIGFSAVLPLLLVLIYLQVNWTLVPVIVVVESCWGIETLRRSARLIKGMKGLALSSLFMYGFYEGILVWNSFLLLTGSNGIAIADNSVSVVTNWVFIVTQSYLVAVLMLSNIAVSTVLYIHCKANHAEIAEEFGKDRVNLLFDDEKVSNAV